MANLREQLRELIAEIGEIDDIETVTDAANLYSELGLDSMQGLEIVLEIEKRFAISVPEETLRTIRSLGDAIRVATELGVKDEG